MQDEDKYRRALELYETTYGALDDDQLAQGLHQVIGILEALPAAELNNADAFHLLGLCRYGLPGLNAENFERAEQAFRSALTVESDHQYANLFLGHVLFDTRRYSEACCHFETIDADYFSSRTQKWRVIKNAELILCCRLQTEWPLVRLDEIEAICAQYETDPAVEFIVPREIVRCLDEFLASNSPPQQAETYASRVVAMLERTDNLSVKYLREPIARLTSIVSRESPPNLPHARSPQTTWHGGAGRSTSSRETRMKKPIFRVTLIILLLGVIGISILWKRGTSHFPSSQLSDAPSSNAAQQLDTARSGKVLIRFKEFEFGKDWNADFEITNDTTHPVFYVGSKDQYRFAYCTLAAKNQEQHQHISFKIRDICYESTFLALQSLQPGESLILAVEKQDVRDLLHPIDVNSEIKAQVGFEIFIGEGKRREILWSDELTFPTSDRL